MVVKWTLAGLLALGASLVAVATIEVGLTEGRAAEVKGQRDAVECSGAPSDANTAAAGLSQTGHGGRSPSSWLIGLALVAVLARLGEENSGLDVL